MKTLELNNLPSPVLLVWRLPEDARAFHVEDNKLFYLADFMGLRDVGAFRDLPSGEWQLIGKLSELTEEQARELVVKEEPTNRWDKGKFRQYLSGVLIPCLTAKESFHSAIEAEGYYLKNPLQQPTEGDYMPNDNFTRKQQDAYWAAFRKWQDAESKTLPANTLIFKKS